MPDFHLPLSGNIAQSISPTQSINPWTLLFNPVNSLFGLINVNLGSSGDPQTEQAILDDVGSYGRQLGRIGDALRVLIDHVAADSLNPTEKAAIDALRLQLDEVDREKARRSVPLVPASQQYR
jgi:hypothetical protein